MENIDCEDYLEMFGRYGITSSDIYMEKDDGTKDRLFELFDRITDMLGWDCPYNNTLPGEFVAVARRYNAGDKLSVLHFDDPDNRLFFLSDLYDLAHLCKTMKQKRQ